MAPDFKTYLATEIISEQRTVSYRTLSRALKIHVNVAKCMLYEFHLRENKKKSGSIYATYLIAGRKKDGLAGTNINGKSTDTNGDMPMPSSPPPYPSSFAESSQRTEADIEERLQVPVKTITLVREEKLPAIRDEYETITSIHIYSLSPGRVPDLQILTDVGRDLFATVFSKEDPLIHNKTYGVIQNPYVRRRKGKRPANIDKPQPKVEPTKTAKPAAVSGSKPTGGSSIANKLTSQPAATAAKNEDGAAASRPSSRDSTSTAESKSKPSLKRDGSSLFKAFAKQSGKPKLTRNDTDASATSEINSGPEDTKMTDADEDQEGESEDEAYFLDNNTRKPASSKKRASDVKKERDDRAAKLRKMMDSDDEAEAEVPTVEEAAGLKAEADEPPAAKKGEDAKEDEDVAWSDSDTEKKAKVKAESKETDDGPKRKRGKRKVMKKRRMKDEEGFLVTREEEVWESFSEDDTETSKPATKSAFSGFKAQGGASAGAQKSTGSKPAAAAAAPADGKKKNIMSFFGKK